MDDMPVVQDLSQRLMHRFPGDTETQENWKWMRFLPPAHLCPQCCTKQKWRKKVVLARNPFVRLASMFQFAWLPATEHPSERKKRELVKLQQAQRELQNPPLSSSPDGAEDASSTSPDASDHSSDPNSAAGGKNIAGSVIPVDTIVGGRSGPYQDWNDFAPWLKHVLKMRGESPKKFAGDYDRFGDREKVLYCRNETLSEDIQKLKAVGGHVHVDPDIEKHVVREGRRR